MDLVVAVSHQQQNRYRRQLTRDEAQQIETGGIRPVRIVQDDHHRALGGDGNEKLPHGGE